QGGYAMRDDKHLSMRPWPWQHCPCVGTTLFECCGVAGHSRLASRTSKPALLSTALFRSTLLPMWPSSMHWPGTAGRSVGATARQSFVVYLGICSRTRSLPGAPKLPSTRPDGVSKNASSPASGTVTALTRTGSTPKLFAVSGSPSGPTPSPASCSRWHGRSVRAYQSRVINDEHSARCPHPGHCRSRGLVGRGPHHSRRRGDRNRPTHCEATRLGATARRAPAPRTAAEPPLVVGPA